jgi:hypothetical protein
MKNYIDWRTFFIAVVIVGLLALIANKLFSVNFWLMFPLVAIVIFINGLIAHFEDERPGGFNNPTTTKPPSNQSNSHE